jgi:hypothetical protein
LSERRFDEIVSAFEGATGAITKMNFAAPSSIPPGAPTEDLANLRGLRPSKEREGENAWKRISKLC